MHAPADLVYDYLAESVLAQVGEHARRRRGKHQRESSHARHRDKSRTLQKQGRQM